MRRALLAAALAVSVVGPGLAAAQHSAAAASAPGAAPAPRRALPQDFADIDLTPTFASLALPGAGQHLLRQDRKWAYLALEVAGWGFFVERRRAGGHYRDRYRDFAWDNGRIQGSTRVDGDFEYFERLAHWTRSGAFDRDVVAPGVQPELDGTTFNGSVWARAVGLFLGGNGNVPETDPAYQSALAYYGSEAYASGLLWDWSGAPAAQAQYADLLETSDSRFRQATTVLGVVIANHVLSAADAYLSSRGKGAAPRVRLLPDVVRGQGWIVAFSIPVRR